VAGAQVLVYIGAISVLVLFAIIAHPEQVGSRQGSSFRPRPCRPAIASVVLAVMLALTVTATEWGDTAARARNDTMKVAAQLFDNFVLPFEVVSVLLLRGGHRRASFWPSARAAAAVSDSLDSLPRPVRPALRDRDVRVPGPPQRDQACSCRSS